MQSFNNTNTTLLLDPNEGTLRKLYFENNNSPQIPKSPDASTLYSSNDGGGLGLTRSSFNTSLRSQRLEQSVRSITEQQVSVLRQKRQEPKMSEIEPEYFDGRVSALDILFPSNHNIHKSSYGLCLWASDPLIDRLY